MRSLQPANLALRFALELSALAATAYWGWTTGDGAMRWVLGIGAPLLVIVVWALFVSPNPRIELARPLRLAIEFGVFAAAAAALAASGHTALAIVFASTALVSGTLNYLWDSTTA
jgi:hypothetical protein